MATPTGSLRILHLSDTHLFGDASRHYGVVDTEAALRRVLARAGELDRADLLVLSGDLSDDGSAASYRLLRELVEPFARERGAEVVYAMGNHDLREGFEAELGPREAVTALGGMRVVTLDSAVPGAGYGRVSDESLSWLRHELARRAERGTVVIVHHPPTPACTPLLHSLELQNAAELLEVCAAGDVRLVLSGHYHHPLVAHERGIPIVVAPGVANTTDALAGSGRERANAGSGFAVIDVPPADAPRVMFVAAPGPDDGRPLFDLAPEEIARIAGRLGA